MRITDLSISGFGIFKDVAITDLSPGLTLFEGRNEAGKSTLMSFIRAVLFGFESRKGAQNRYEPLRGGKHGGWLTLLSDEQTIYRIERGEGSSAGRLSISDLEGHHYDEDMLQRLLYGTSKVLYQNVFAFGLGELQRLDTLHAEEVSHHIYTAGMGTGATPFARVMSTLEEEQGQIFKPGGKKPAINLLLARLDEMQRQIRERQAIPDEYYVLREEIKTVDNDIQHLRRQLHEAEQRVDWLGTLLRARTDWERMVALKRELEDLPDIVSFPEGGIERLEQTERALGQLDRRRGELERTVRDLEERRSALHPDPVVLEHQETIQALSEDREHFRKLLEQVPTLRAKMESRRKALDDILLRLGPAWNDRRLAEFDASIPMRERIRGFRDRLAPAKHEAAEAGKRRDEAERVKKAKEAEVDRLQRHLETLIPADAPARPPLEERERALHQWAYLHHQLELMRQRRKSLQDMRDPLAEQARGRKAEIVHLEIHKGMPTWVIIAIGVLFALLAAAAVSMNQWLLASGSIALGILLEGLLIWWKDRLGDERLARLDELQRQHQALAVRAREVLKEVERLDSEQEDLARRMLELSTLAAGQAFETMEEAEEARRALDAERRLVDRRLDLDARVQEEEESLVRLLNEREVLDHTSRAADQAYEEAEEAWASFLATIELAEGLTPDGALEVLATVEGAKAQLREWSESTQAVQRTEQEIASAGEQINAVLERCGRAPTSLIDAPSAILALRKALGESLHARLEGDRLVEISKEKQRELETTEAERARALEQRQSLLAAAGAYDGEDFRRRAAIFKQRAGLEREIRQHETALEVHAGTAEARQILEERLSTATRAELERESAEAETTERGPLAEALARKLQDKGRLEQQLQSLEHNDRLSESLLDYQTLLAQLDQQAQRWAVRAVTRHLLDKARQTYERERQPAVLKQASEFFRVMTGGRYKRVIVPFGETRLEVELKNGRTQSTDRLSRGTAEQLYLSMRLAFVREYAKHAGPLPLVVDDILVNFDPDRARAAIKVLAEIARTHQVLFFTCHPHVLAWFKEQIPDTMIQPLPPAA